jgi:hypothetical protein
VHMILAFVKYKGTGGAKAELTNIHDWINIVRVSIIYARCRATVTNIHSPLTKSPI